MVIKSILDKTYLPNEIIDILLEYIPHCFYCQNYSMNLEIELSNLLGCYCDIDKIYCNHKPKYICENCSDRCLCGAVIYKHTRFCID